MSETAKRPGGKVPSREKVDSRTKVDNPKQVDLLRIGAASTRFEQVMEIDEYAQQVIGSRPLWRSLVRAIIDEVDPTDAGPVSIVLANNPLVAIAGATAVGERTGRPVRVPMAAHESSPIPGMLASHLRQFGQNERLQDWLTRATTLGEAEEQGRSVLVRAWGVPPVIFADELADTPAPLKAGLIATVQTADPEDAEVFREATVWNAAGPLAPIIARVIHALRLPTHQPCASLDDARELLQRLLASNDVDGILRQLNTPEHDSFDRAAWRLDGEQRPETSALFNEHVLAGGEDRPRHTAALYLVSHFSRISPAQLVAMGDVLARHTPAAEPGADMLRAPPEVTDKVLKDCGIRVVETEDQGGYALLGPRDGMSTTEEPIQVAGRLRMLFQRDAPLLTERYLLKLAQDLTMGHASEAISDTYQALELEALRSAAALDPVAACERLVRIAFAHPVLAGIRAPEESEWRNLVQNVDRLTVRMPDFLKQVADIPRLPINDAVAALCSASPATLDEGRMKFFRRSAACIFWGAYAAGVPGLTLQAFPGLFDRSEEGLARRHALVDSLRAILDNEAPDPLLQPLTGLFADAQLLGRLLADVGIHFSRIRFEQGLDIALLVDVASNVLLASLPRRPWRDVTPGSAAADRPLAQALLSGRSQSWWREPSDQALTDPQRLYRIARAVIEGLVASSSFNELEELSIDIWLIDAIDVDQTPENIDARYFHDIDAWHDINGLGKFLFQAVRPLLALFSLLVLMAATRTGTTPEGSPVFTFSDPLRQWLVNPDRSPDERPLKQLTDMLAEARRFQEAWRTAHDHWHLAVSDRGKIVPAFKERVDAVRAFERALKPLIEQSRRQAPSVRMQGGAPPSTAAPPPSTAKPE